MTHIGRNTRSTIVSKGISAGQGNNSYRGQVKVMPKAAFARNYTQCDSMLIGNRCGAHTFPYIEVQNRRRRWSTRRPRRRSARIRSSISRSAASRKENAVSMIVAGFCKDVFKELPMEFALEAQQLLGITLEGSVG